MTGRHDPATPPARRPMAGGADSGGAIGRTRCRPPLERRAVGRVQCSGPEFHDRRMRLMDDQQRHAKGLEMRRAVLGEAHVDRAIAQTTPLTQEFQDLDHALRMGRDLDASGSRRSIAPHSRHRHDDRNRPLGRVPDARGRRVARRRLHDDDLKEIVLQQAIYCGVPAAHHALTVIAEIGQRRQVSRVCQQESGWLPLVTSRTLSRHSSAKRRHGCRRIDQVIEFCQLPSVIEVVAGIAPVQERCHQP